MRLVGIVLMIALVGGLSTSRGCTSAAAQSAAETPATNESADDRYNEALNRNNGSRVYGYRWSEGYLHPIGHALFLIVKADGTAEITGSVVNPVQLSAQDVAPFEAAVIAAGFPKLRGAPPEPLCLDHFPLANTFEAAIDGVRARTVSNNCGEYDASVDKAFRELLELVNAHGGLAPAAPQIEESPIAVKVLTPSQFRRLHK